MGEWDEFDELADSLKSDPAARIRNSSRINRHTRKHRIYGGPNPKTLTRNILRGAKTVAERRRAPITLASKG